MLKIFFDSKTIGYADVSPWAQLGDESLDFQIESLKSLKPTPLLERAFYFARIDSEARKNKKNLLSDLNLPKSHYFIKDILNFKKEKWPTIKNQGFDVIKLKMGKSLNKETIRLKEFCNEEPRFQWRLDFNCQLSKEDFFAWWKGVQSWLSEKIQFIEDPFPYEPSSWKKWYEAFGVPLALDRFFPNSQKEWGGFQVAVLKPAYQDIRHLSGILVENNKACTITSYLGHPFEQMTAAYETDWLNRTHPQHFKGCGLLGHMAFEEDPCFSCFTVNNGKFSSVSGYGFGFDNYLKTIKWQDL